MFSQASRLFNVDPSYIENPENDEFVTIYRNKLDGNYYGRLSNGTDEQINGSSAAPGWLLDGNTVVAEKWFGTADNFDVPIRVNNIEIARFSDSFTMFTVDATSSPFLNGIVSITNSGYAIQGNTTGSGYGVRGFNAVGYGVGVEGESVNNVGVLGRSTNGVGVQGLAPIGVYGQSTTATSGTFALQCYNIAAVQLMAVRGDGRVMVGIGAPTARLHVDSTLAAGSTQLLRLTRSGTDIFVVEDFGSILCDTGGFSSVFTIRSNQANITLKSNGGTEPQINFLYNDGASTSGILKGGGSSMFLETPLFGIGTAYFIPTARLHTKGVDATSGNFAFKAQDVAANDLFTVRNDGFVGVGITQFDTETMRVTGYSRFNSGAAIGGAPLVGNSYTLPGGGSVAWDNGNQIDGTATHMRLRGAGDVFKFSNSGVTYSLLELNANASFFNASPATGVVTTTVYDMNIRSSYWDGAVAINNNAIIKNTAIDTLGKYKLGIYTAAVERFFIRETGDINLPTLQNGNAGLASGDLYKDTAANILANGDLVIGRKV